MKLIDVLKMMDELYKVELGWRTDSGSIDIRPNAVFEINLCFMSEEETWINTYPDHPMLVPLYDVEVVGFYPERVQTLNIWLDLEDFVTRMSKYRLENKND